MRYFLALLLLALTSCGQPARLPVSPDRPMVLTSFTILQSLTEAVAGDLFDIRTITPAGGEVHEWELIPSNFADVEDAALILYNGYNIEGWIRQVYATARPGTPLIAVAEASGYPTLPIRIGDRSGSPDPHLWMHPAAAQAYVRVIRDALTSLRPDQADQLNERANQKIAALDQLAAQINALFDAVDPAHRILITSEAAFPYFADAFGFEHDAIWGSNDEEEGTPRQIARLVDIIRARQIPVAFYESTISDRHMRSVAEETGIRVAGPLFVDSIGSAEQDLNSLSAILLANARLIANALTAP